MASIQKKRNGWYCQFMHARRRYTFAIGRVNDVEAEAIRARANYVLMRLKQGLMEIPPGTDVISFVRHNGKPPMEKAESVPAIAFKRFREIYLDAFSHG